MSLLITTSFNNSNDNEYSLNGNKKKIIMKNYDPNVNKLKQFMSALHAIFRVGLYISLSACVDHIAIFNVFNNYSQFQTTAWELRYWRTVQRVPYC